MHFLLALSLLQAAPPALENDFVRVSRDAAPCASAAVPGCGDRIIVALGDIEVRSGNARRTLPRGGIAVFRPGESYDAPAGAGYFEIVLKEAHPSAPAIELIPPEKNAILHDADRFFVFEERLAVGDTRARHGHNHRVVIQLNATRLEQWPDGEPAIIRDIVPDGVAFNPPVIHVVRNVGARPLRGIVIEFRARR